MKRLPKTCKCTPLKTNSLNLWIKLSAYLTRKRFFYSSLRTLIMAMSKSDLAKKKRHFPYQFHVIVLMFFPTMTSLSTNRSKLTVLCLREISGKQILLEFYRFMCLIINSMLFPQDYAYNILT